MTREQLYVVRDNNGEYYSSQYFDFVLNKDFAKEMSRGQAEAVLNALRSLTGGSGYVIEKATGQYPGGVQEPPERSK